MDVSDKPAMVHNGNDSRVRDIPAPGQSQVLKLGAAAKNTATLITGNISIAYCEFTCILQFSQITTCLFLWVFKFCLNNI